MKQLLIRRGRVTVENVPAPLIEDGHVLVEVAYSLISAGTEISNIKSSGKSLFKRALEQPEKVKQLLDHLRHQGIRKTIAKVQGQLGYASPIGYSCSGIVIQVGKGVRDIQPGERVACAGAGIANHAEIVLVPRNLVVKVPEGCDLKAAASVALGAIAMQGVRDMVFPLRKWNRIGQGQRSKGAIPQIRILHSEFRNSLRTLELELRPKYFHFVSGTE
jgi:NADPH:quinone reductase-like Zn-dependent oxidoreductase